jgi:hypothetical protein
MSTDLDSMDEVFKIIITIFSCKTKNQDYYDALQKFQQLVNKRPHTKEEIDAIINKDSLWDFEEVKEEDKELGEEKELEEDQTNRNAIP